MLRFINNPAETVRGNLINKCGHFSCFGCSFESKLQEPEDRLDLGYIFSGFLSKERRKKISKMAIFTHVKYS